MLPSILLKRPNPGLHSLVHNLGECLFYFVGFTLIASFWFSSTPLPFGGPNVLLGVGTTFLAFLYISTNGNIRTTLLADISSIQILIVALLMMIWMAKISSATNTFSKEIFWSSMLGPGVFFAAVLSVTSELRSWMLSVTITITTLLSVIFGVLVLHGDPFFWTLWLDLTASTQEFSEDVEMGRLAGLAPRVVNLSFHLTLAIPLSVALLLFNPVRRKIVRHVSDIGIYITATILLTAVFLNASRSLLISATCGIALVLAAPVLAPGGRQKIVLIRRGVLSTFLLTAGVFVMLTTYNAIFQKNTPLDLEYVLPPVPSCIYPIGKISRKIHIVDRWSTDCISLRRPDSLARYYRFTLEHPSMMSIAAISDGTNPYLYLYSEKITLEPYAENDNGGNQLNARIVDGRLDPGTYIIELTTYDPTPPEDFSLTITMNCPSEETITVTGYDKNFLTSAWGEGCPPSGRQGGGVARYFTFRLNETSEFNVQVETDGLHPHIYLRSENGAGRILPPTDSTRKLIGDRWKYLKQTYHNLHSGNYMIEVTKDVVGVEGNFVIASWKRFHAEEAPIEIPAPSISNEIQSQAKSRDQSKRSSVDMKRLFTFDEGALLRLYTMITAVRYALEFPLGTGHNYRPTLNHVDKDWGRKNVTEILSYIPHNQFLHCLVQYGFPGLALLVVLYVSVLASSIRAIRLYHRCRISDSPFLLFAPSASLFAYVINSQFHNHGPFTRDWAHFVILGLVIQSNRLAIISARRVSTHEYGNQGTE